MSGRRSRTRRARTNRRFSRSCYGRQGNAGSLDDKPAFDTTPFDSSSGGSAWETLPTESIFSSSDCESSEAPSPDHSDWLSSAEHRALVSFLTTAPNLIPCDDEISLAPRVASGYSGTASPSHRRVLDRSNTPGISPLSSSIASSPGRSQLSSCESSEAPSPDHSDWLSSAEHRALVSFLSTAPNLIPCDDDISLAPRVASGYNSGTASPSLGRVLDRSNTPGRSPLNSSIASSSGRSRLSSCESSEAPSPDLSDWRSSAEHSALVSLLSTAPNLIPCDGQISLAPRVASGYSGSASPSLGRVLHRSNTPGISPLNSSIASSSGRSRSSSCKSSKAPSPDLSDWRSSAEHSALVSFLTTTPNFIPCDGQISLAPRVASGYSGTASPLLRRVLDRSKTRRISPLNSTISSSSGRSRLSSSPAEFCSPSSSGPDYTISSSELDTSGLSPSSSGLSMYADISDSASSHDSQFSEDSADDDANNKPITVTTPPSPWNPHLASERLEDPNNPPPMFHPTLSNEWRTDPNISEEIRNMYDASSSDYSGYHGIFNYGRLSEFNTQNLYDPERFACSNDQGDYTPAYENADCSEVFGDPHEALARPTDNVPDKYRKEKWHYFELKKRLELFKRLGMDGELAMYEGQLERMEADPWTGDDSGEEIEVYMRGMEGDPALDEQLEKMEALVAPENEGRKAFYAAMENPPPPYDRDLELMEQLVSEENEGRRAFFEAMKNPPPWGELDSYLLDGSFQTCIVGDDTQLEKLTSYTDPSRRAFERAMENPPPPCRDEFADSSDDGLERMEQLVTPTNEGRGAFYAAMENPSPGVTDQNDSFRSCFGLGDLEALVSPRNEQRRAFFAAMMGNPSPGDTGNSFLNDSFLTCSEGNDSQMEDSNLNTTITLPEGSSVDFPPDSGPDSC